MPDSKSPIRVLHLVNGLDVNGVKTVLYNLIVGSNGAEMTHEILSLSARGAMADRFRALDVPLKVVSPAKSRGGLVTSVKAAFALRNTPVDVVQCWETKSNLLAGLARRRPGPPVVWGIHCMLRPGKAPRRGTRWGMRLQRLAARFHPARVVCCSEGVRQLYAELGYWPHQLVTIENGIDTDRFAPQPAARAELRAELAPAPETLLVGMIANYAPVKDFPCFFAAARQLKERLPGVRFVLAGSKVTPENQALLAEVRAAGLEQHVHLLGERHDLPRVYAALDLLVGTSRSEALSMVLLEGMSCGLACAVTDVGDLRHALGVSGRLVPPRDPAAAAAAWLELLQLAPADREALGAAARQRICSYFSARTMAAEYAQLYRHLVAR